ncbi:MAG: ADP-glyceromanno-heptose 6-epimerase [Candidatus Aureabacteria bacterium]|nr:ADP-glyceromanno-heptose 6-epimerase [Candidatus Auribacterota bacterium]
MNSTIILTGGAGFIGSCFLRKLNAEGIDNIIIVDNLNSPHKQRNLDGKAFKDYIHKKNFLELLERGSLAKIGTVIHLGACSLTTTTDAAYLAGNNFEYSKALAAWAHSRGIPFIYASSAATYGAGEFGYSDAHETTSRLRPLNLYGYYKQLFDLWILDHKLDREMTGIKFFNVFGPNEYHKGEMMSVICKNFSHVCEKVEIELYKSYRDGCPDGEQKRDFIYVKDAVNVLFYFLVHTDKTGIFNLGTGVARSWNDLANAMFSALQLKPNIRYIEMPELLRENYQYFTQAKTDKLRHAGYETEFMTLEDAVRDYVGYLKEGRYF